MADGKKSFLLYCDLIHTVELLDDILAGKLFKLLLKYVNDENPEPADILLKIAFEPIKRQLKRDLRDWEASVGKRSDAGVLGNLKRWHPDIYEQVIAEKITLKQASEIAKHHKSSHSDNCETGAIPIVANIADNVTVTVSDTVNPKELLPPKDFKDAAAAAKKTEKKNSQVTAERLKEIANKSWSDRLWVESVCLGLSFSAEDLKKWMALFNSSLIGDSVEDFSESRYKRMCRGWIAKQQEKGVKVESGNLKKTSDSPPLKKIDY